MKPIPIYGFDHLSDAELIQKTNHIIDKMTGNPNYPDATPKVTKVSTAKTEFEAACTAAQDGGKTVNTEKKKKRKVLQKALKELALYVQLNCNEDLAIMLTSGYDGRRDGEPSGEPDNPKNFTIEPGKNSGTVKASVDVDENTDVYIYEYALVVEGAEPVWKTKIYKRTVIIKDLIPGRQYMFRVALKGRSGELVYSEIITRYVS